MSHLRKTKLLFITIKMKSLLFFPIFFILSFSIASAHELIEKDIFWYHIKMIRVDRSHGDTVIVGISKENGESLKSLVERYWWVSWVNGWFFCPADYKECSWMTYSQNDRVSFGEDYSRWDETWDRAIFAFDKKNIPFIYQTWKIIKKRRSEIYHWIWNYPLLMLRWKNNLENYEHLIWPKMRLKITKNFICSTENNQVVYMWMVEAISIDSLIPVLTAIWCYNALNLDAGNSTAMQFEWDYLYGPWRDITDAFIVVNKKETIKILNKKLIPVYHKLEKYLWKRDIKVRMRAIEFLKKVDKKLSKRKKIEKKYLYMVKWLIKRLEMNI